MKQLVLFLICWQTSVAWGVCASVFIPAYEWQPRTMILPVDLPLEDLSKNGVAFGELPARFFGSELNDTKIDIFLITTLQELFPGHDVIPKYSSPSLYKPDILSRKPEDLQTRTDTTLRFHEDVANMHVEPNRARFREGRLSKFTIRATVVAPSNLHPPTIVIPLGGLYEGLPVQAKLGRPMFTVFIADIIRHSSDDRFKTITAGAQRGVRLIQFQVQPNERETSIKTRIVRDAQ